MTKQYYGKQLTVDIVYLCNRFTSNINVSPVMQPNTNEWTLPLRVEILTGTLGHVCHQGERYFSGWVLLGEVVAYCGNVVIF